MIFLCIAYIYTVHCEAHSELFKDWEKLLYIPKLRSLSQGWIWSLSSTKLSHPGITGTLCPNCFLCVLRMLLGILWDISTCLRSIQSGWWRFAAFGGCSRSGIKKVSSSKEGMCRVIRFFNIKSHWEACMTQFELKSCWYKFIVTQLNWRWETIENEADEIRPPRSWRRSMIDQTRTGGEAPLRLVSLILLIVESLNRWFCQQLNRSLFCSTQKWHVYIMHGPLTLGRSGVFPSDYVRLYGDLLLRLSLYWFMIWFYRLFHLHGCCCRPDSK